MLLSCNDFQLILRRFYNELQTLRGPADPLLDPGPWTMDLGAWTLGLDARRLVLGVGLGGLGLARMSYVL